MERRKAPGCRVVLRRRAASRTLRRDAVVRVHVADGEQLLHEPVHGPRDAEPLAEGSNTNTNTSSSSSKTPSGHCYRDET